MASVDRPMWNDVAAEIEMLESLLRRQRVEDEPRLLARLYELYLIKHPARPGAGEAQASARLVGRSPATQEYHHKCWGDERPRRRSETKP